MTEPLLALRALADPTRLALARLLVEGAFNVGEVQEVLGLGQSVASRHLKLLSDAGLVSSRKDGRLVFYQWRADLPEGHRMLRRYVEEHAPALADDASERLQRVFGERSERSTRFFAQPETAALVSAEERQAFVGVDVLSQVHDALPAGGTVVDLGAGVGRLFGTLRKGGRNVIAVDASPSMLEAAGKHVAKQRWTDVELRLGTLEHLPLADREASSAVAHQVLHHVARPEQALAEACRVLDDGGVFVWADYLPHEQEWMRDERADQWLGFDPQEVARMLEAAGFENVSIRQTPSETNALGMFVARAVRSASAPARLVEKTKTGASHRARRKTA